MADGANRLTCRCRCQQIGDLFGKQLWARDKTVINASASGLVWKTTPVRDNAILIGSALPPSRKSSSVRALEQGATNVIGGGVMGAIIKLIRALVEETHRDHRNVSGSVFVHFYRLPPLLLTSDFL